VLETFRKISFLWKYVLCLGEVPGPERASGFNKNVWALFFGFCQLKKIQASPLQSIFFM